MRLNLFLSFASWSFSETAPLFCIAQLDWPSCCGKHKKAGSESRVHSDLNEEGRIPQLLSLRPIIPPWSSEEKTLPWSRRTRSVCSDNSWAQTSCHTACTCSVWRPSASACERVGSSGRRRLSHSAHNRTVSPPCGNACGPAAATAGWRLCRTRRTCAWGRGSEGAWPWQAWRRTLSHRWGTSWPVCCPRSGASACVGSGLRTWRRFCHTRCRCASGRCLSDSPWLSSWTARPWWKMRPRCSPHSRPHRRWCIRRRMTRPLTAGCQAGPSRRGCRRGFWCRCHRCGCRWWTSGSGRVL